MFKLLKTLAIGAILFTSSLASPLDKDIEFENENLLVKFDGRSAGFRMSSPSLNDTNHFWHVKWNSIEECGGVVNHARKGIFENMAMEPSFTETNDSKTLSLTFQSETMDITIDNTVYYVPTMLEYGNSTIYVTPDMLKFSMTIRRWNFSPSATGLCMKLKVSTNFGGDDVDEMETEPEISYDKETARFVLANSHEGYQKENHKIRYGKFGTNAGMFVTPNTVIVDGVEANAVVTQNKGGLINIQIPRFTEYAYYDPISYIEDSGRVYSSSDASESNSYNYLDLFIIAVFIFIGM